MEERESRAMDKTEKVEQRLAEIRRGVGKLARERNLAARIEVDLGIGRYAAKGTIERLGGDFVLVKEYSTYDASLDPNALIEVRMVDANGRVVQEKLMPPVPLPT
jgi:hypothetical protein